MLRTLTFALVLAIPGIAHAQPAQTQFPQSAIGAEVRGSDGTILGQVTSVERNEAGEIVASEIPGLEPEDAPRPMIVASAERNDARLVRERSARAETPSIVRASGATRSARTR
jgi:hypothetical protein